MLAVVKAAKILLNSGSVLSRVIFSRGGYRGRYGTYYLKVNEIAEQGKRYRVVIGKDYVDYIEDPNGEFFVTRKSWTTRYIRFPIRYEGPVLIVPLENGFRVYLLKEQ